MSRRSPMELTRIASPVTFALDRLCSRTLRGMFDGPTNVNVAWGHGAGVVLDLSAVFQNSAALPLVMLAAISWLSAVQRQSSEVRVLQIIDEAWAAIRDGASYFQSSLKLSRALGVSTGLVCHRPSDLSAQTDDGTADSKIAAGLLSDIQTRVLLRQPTEQLDVAATLFDLSPREREWVGQLPRGRALWRLNDRTAVVQQVLTPAELALFATDAAMSA
jgi:type IV secretory pathway VirB4 component